MNTVLVCISWTPPKLKYILILTDLLRQNFSSKKFQLKTIKEKLRMFLILKWCVLFQLMLQFDFDDVGPAVCLIILLGSVYLPTFLLQQSKLSMLNLCSHSSLCSTIVCPRSQPTHVKVQHAGSEYNSTSPSISSIELSSCLFFVPSWLQGPTVRQSCFQDLCMKQASPLAQWPSSVWHWWILLGALLLPLFWKSPLLCWLVHALHSHPWSAMGP